MTVTSIRDAWAEVQKIFPTRYEHDASRSERAGYPIYYSTAAGVNAWISDLGNRLEVNLPDGKGVDIWIEAPVEAAATGNSPEETEDTGNATKEERRETAKRMGDTLRISLKGSGKVSVSIQQGNNKDFFLEAIEDWARLTSVQRAVIKAEELAEATDPDALIWEILQKLVQECHINREARKQIAALVPTPNDPLTEEQLQEMAGKPVWLKGEGLNRWDISSGVSADGIACFWKAALPVEECGKTWTPYLRKPENQS